MVLPDDGEPRIGMNVRAARRSRGMSLETLAGLIGRSKGWLSKIENGHARLERRQDIAAIARALGVSADGLLGEPAPEIRPDGQMYNVMPLQRALLDAAPDDPPDIPVRPIELLGEEVERADTALREADHATAVRILGSVIGELCVHAATHDKPGRTSALRLLVRACVARYCRGARGRRAPATGSHRHCRGRWPAVPRRGPRIEGRGSPSLPWSRKDRAARAIPTAPLCGQATGAVTGRDKSSPRSPSSPSRLHPIGLRAGEASA